jgi:FtsZ-binding cell division protein ZapB
MKNMKNKHKTGKSKKNGGSGGSGGRGPGGPQPPNDGWYVFLLKMFNIIAESKLIRKCVKYFVSCTALIQSIQYVYNTAKSLIYGTEPSAIETKLIEEVKSIKAENKDLKDEVKDVKAENKDLKDEVKEKDDEIRGLKSEINSLRSRPKSVFEQGTICQKIIVLGRLEFSKLHQALLPIPDLFSESFRYQGV